MDLAQSMGWHSEFGATILTGWICNLQITTESIQYAMYANDTYAVIYVSTRLYSTTRAGGQLIKDNHSDPYFPSFTPPRLGTFLMATTGLKGAPHLIQPGAHEDAVLASSLTSVHLSLVRRVTPRVRKTAANQLTRCPVATPILWAM